MAIAADHWVQFSDGQGGVYFYNFADGSTAKSIEALLRRADPQAAAAASPNASPKGASPKPEPPVSLLSQLEGAGAGTPAALMSTNSVDRAYGAQLYARYEHLLSATLASGPRPVRETLNVARKYGINLERELDCLWLADLSLSLPVPAGWLQLDHPKEGVPYWHNTILGVSMWQHPTDEYIRTVLKIHRAPHHLQVRTMASSSLARVTPVSLTGDKLVPPPPTVKNLIENSHSTRT
jgi:hypothetical protein